MTTLTPIKQQPIFNQLSYYANTGIAIGELSREAQYSLYDIADELYNGYEEEEGESPIIMGSRDFKQWVKHAIDNGIYTADNIN